MASGLTPWMVSNSAEQVACVPLEEEQQGAPLWPDKKAGGALPSISCGGRQEQLECGMIRNFIKSKKYNIRIN